MCHKNLSQGRAGENNTGDAGRSTSVYVDCLGADFY